MATTIQDLLDDPDFKRLNRNDQRRLKEAWFNNRVAVDAGYQALPEQERNQLRKATIEAGEPPSKSFADLAGWSGAGPVEGLTGSKLGRVVDVPLKALNTLPALVGSGVEAATGSPGLGLAADIGSGILVPWAVNSKIKAALAAKRALMGAKAATAVAEAGPAVGRGLAGVSEVGNLAQGPGQFAQHALARSNALAAATKGGKAVVDPITGQRISRAMLQERIADDLAETDKLRRGIQPELFPEVGKLSEGDDLLRIRSGGPTPAPKTFAELRAEQQGLGAAGKITAPGEAGQLPMRFPASAQGELFGEPATVGLGASAVADRARRLSQIPALPPRGGTTTASKLPNSGRIFHAPETPRPTGLPEVLPDEYGNLRVTPTPRAGGVAEQTIPRGVPGEGAGRIDRTGIWNPQAGFISSRGVAVASGLVSGAAGGEIYNERTGVEDPTERVANVLAGAALGAGGIGVALRAARLGRALAVGPAAAAIEHPAGGVTIINSAGRSIRTSVADIEKVGEGLAIPPSGRARIPRDVADAVDAIDSGPIPTASWIAVRIAVGKTKLEKLFPRVFGFPMHDISRGIPPLEAMVDTVDGAADIARSIEGWFLENLNRIYKPVVRDNGAITRINQWLDGKDVILSGAERGIASQARRLLDTAADNMKLAPGDRLSNYFFHLRDKTLATTTPAITIGGETRPIRNIITLGEGKASYLPRSVNELIPTEYRPAFLKRRTFGEGEFDYSLKPLMAYARGFGRRVALSGGIDPRDGAQVSGALDALRPHLGAVPEGLLDTTARWLNDVLGATPRASGRLLSTETVHSLKTLQFGRLIAANFLSPALNLTQGLNTFARTRLTSFMGALTDLADPAANALARKYGVAVDLSKAETDIAATLAGSRFETVVNKLSGLFRGSEKLVRLHAFHAGMREATASGMIGDEAAKFARKMVDTTQFRFGRESAPASFRAEGSGLGELVQQFKTYPINQALFIKNLIVDDVKDLRRLNVLGATRTAKYFGAMFALFGSDAPTMGVDKTLSKVFTDNDETLRVNGLFPAMGIYIAGQLGLGAMPIEDLRSALFFLPGPALAMVSDAISVATALPELTGVKSDPTAPYGRDFSLGNFMKPMTAEQLASKLTRLLPVGGIFANRLRRALLETQTPGEVREAGTLRQAFGMEPMTGFERLVQQGTSQFDPLRTAVGVSSPERARDLEHGKEQVDLLAAHQAATRNAARLVSLGKTQDALEVMHAFEKQYGVPLRLSPSSVRSAFQQGIMTTTERRARTGPRDLRMRLLGE